MKKLTFWALGLHLWSAPVLADQTESLRSALAASAAGDWQTALTAAQGAAPEGADVILWQWLRASQGKRGFWASMKPFWPAAPIGRACRC